MSAPLIVTVQVRKKTYYVTMEGGRATKVQCNTPMSTADRPALRTTWRAEPIRPTKTAQLAIHAAEAKLAAGSKPASGASDDAG